MFGLFLCSFYGAGRSSALLPSVSLFFLRLENRSRFGSVFDYLVCGAVCVRGGYPRQGPVSGARRTGDSGGVRHGIYFNGGSTIGSGACDAGQGQLYLAAIPAITRSHRSFPKLL